MEQIEIVVDNVIVTGEITYRDSADISIRITSPFRDHGTGSHIFYLARGVHSFIGEFGDRTARSLLAQLYRMLKSFDERREILRQQIIPYQQQIDQIPIFTQDDYHRERLELRRRYRAGEIDQKSFSIDQGKNKRRLLQYQLSVGMIQLDFLMKCVPGSTVCDCEWIWKELSDNESNRS